MLQTSLSEFADKMQNILPTIIREFARRQANELYRGKITLPQFLILEYLYREGESKMTNLAHFMSVTTAATTGIIDRLVGYGYCTRTYEPKDRRIIKIKLNQKGTELVRNINQQRRKMLIRLFGKISEKERRDYLNVLMRIHDILSEEKAESR